MDRAAELDVVRRLAAGDAAAFDELYAAYHGRLFGFLARLSRRRDVAEDLVEETWLRLVAHAPRLRPDTCLAAWLFTVARRLYFSYCRSRRVEADSADVLLGLWPAGRIPASPFETTAAGELERRVEAALNEMPAMYREVLLLVAMEGFTPAEAAEVCGIRPEALRQRLSRARSMLAAALQAVPGTPTGIACEVPA